MVDILLMKVIDELVIDGIADCPSNKMIPNHAFSVRGTAVHRYQ